MVFLLRSQIVICVLWICIGNIQDGFPLYNVYKCVICDTSVILAQGLANFRPPTHARVVETGYRGEVSGTLAKISALPSETRF